MSKSTKNFSKILVICLIALLCSGPIFFSLFLTPTRAQGANQKNVLVISKGDDTHFITSFSVDRSNFNITVESESAFSSIGNWIDMVVVFDASLDLIKRQEIINFTNNGGAVAIFMGPQLHTNGSLLSGLGLINKTIYDLTKRKNSEIQLFIPNNYSNPISTYIDWNSAPDMKVDNMTLISKDSLGSHVHSIIDVYPASKNLQINQYKTPILMEVEKGNGNVILFAGWVEDKANLDFTLWPYFNYFLYTIAFETLGKPFQTYPNWDYSPVPHEFERLIILILIICLAILAVSLFVIVKRRSRSTIDQTTVEALKKKAEEEEEKRVREAEEFKKKIEEEGREDLKDDWEVIGIHRQLGGFLFTFFIGLFLVIPQLLVTNFIMPQFIQPYPQAAGWYYYAYNLFQIAWLLFDFGTSYALAKYFSQYRVNNPEKAIHYIQIFVWWQLFTGLAQISIFAFIGSLIFPYTNIAHMSWVLITFSLVQYPGFFLVFMYTFQGLQRADLHLITYVAWEVVWLLVGQVIFCYLGRIWGAANPVIGEALGAGIGYSVARYFDYWMTFFLSFVLFKRQGYSPKTCFRIDFTKEEFKESMRYGSKLAFGESFVQIGWFIQIIITSAFIANYSNELGYFNLAWNVGMIVQLVTLYGQSLLGAFSESNSHGKKTLTRLYIYQAFRWGNYFAYFIISVLLATGGLFLVGAAGEDYGGPAVRFMPLILIFHGFGIYSWLVDAVFQGTGKTGYAALVWILEQSIRALLMFLLVILTKDMAFVIIAYMPAVLTKDIIAWIIVRYKIIKYKIYWYKTFITPLLSALVNFIVLFFLGNFLWSIEMGDKIINTAIIFLIGIFLFMYFFAFLDGLFGGYDNNTLKEFEKATDMVKVPFIGFFPRALYKVAALGAKISPLHNKLPIDIYEKGMAEAFELTLEKKVLTI